MKKAVIILVGVFEIICGISGEIMVLGSFLGLYPHDVLPILWYGIFPLASCIAGIMLLLRSKFALELSVVILVLQIPFIYISGISLLRVGLAFNVYLTAVWNSRTGGEPTILGFNLLALVVFILLFWARSALDDYSTGRETATDSALG